MAVPVIHKLLSAALRAPAPCYLFIGPLHVGKRVEAQSFIAQLLGLAADDARWNVHPDFIELKPLEGKVQISVEQVRDLRERVVLRPSVASRVVVYVPHADRLNDAGTNALLKITEEPPAGAVFVLVAEDLGRIPATLQSRSVILPFQRVGRIEPTFTSSRGADFVRDFLLAPSAGARLALIEDLTKSCDGEEDSVLAWKETLLQAMYTAEKSLVSQPEVIGALGIALIASLRLVGGAVSPRTALEVCAVRLSEDPKNLFASLQPDHLSSPLHPLFTV